MFQRRGRRKMSADETGSLRERELRLKVAELRGELEEEKRARKRDQYEKVREMRSVREREQDSARETIDGLKMKQSREKAQEMEMLRDQMTKDFKVRMREVQQKNEEEKHMLRKELDKERRNMKEQRKTIEKEVEKQIKQVQQTEQKKLTQEMSTMASQISELEEKLKDCQVADRTKAEVIRQMKSEHQAELESFSHSSKLSSRQQLVELEASKRDVKEREKEISSNLERIRRLEADKDRLQEEVRRLRKAESWARSTPTITPPSLTPSTSNGDLTSPRQYTQKERDMVLKNTELSFRVRQLEEQNTELEKYKKELKDLLEKAQAEQRPLREQLGKQGIRVNTLNASLHDKEKLVKRITEENESLKKANRELIQEQVEQKRRLNQQMNQTHTLRMEHQRAIGKYADLQKVCKKLQIRVKEMEQLRRSNSHQSAVAGVVGLLAVNPEPSSLSVSMTSVETGGEEGDAEQAWAKYREMKKEYVTMKDHYKKLKSSYDKLEQKVRLYEQEKLAIESEVSKLRASPINERDSPYDMVRSSTMLSESRQELERLQSRVMKLEAFIVAQDEKHCVEMNEYRRELESVTEDRDRLQEQLQSSGLQREEGEGGEGEGEEEEGEGEDEEDENEEESVGEGSSELLKQITAVEKMNLEASHGVRETKEMAKAMDDYHSEMDRTIQGIATLEEELLLRSGRWTDREPERVVLVLKKVKETVAKCQELLSSGQDVSEVVERLAVLLTDQQPSPSSHLDDTGLGLDTAGSVVPVDSSTPSAHRPLVTEIGRLKEELSLKQESVERATEKVASLQSLVGELEGRLEEEKKEKEGRAASWEQEVAALQTQLSQKDSKLTRLRRGISRGVNEHMHQQLGHQAFHTLQQCKLSASRLAGSESVLSELEELEASLHSLLHTVFPGMFQQQQQQEQQEPQQSPLAAPPTEPASPIPDEAPSTKPASAVPNEAPPTEPTSSVPPPTEPTSFVPDESPSPTSHHSTHQDQDDQTVPQMSPSHSPSRSPPLSPPSSPPHAHDHAQTTPPPRVEEVMVMRSATCEEIVLPLSTLLEAPPTDHTHSEPSAPEVPSSPLPPEEDIGELADPSHNSPSRSPIPSEMIRETSDQQQLQEVQEVILKLDSPSGNSPSNESTHYVFTGGREYTHEDLEEVDLTSSIELERRAKGGLEVRTGKKEEEQSIGETRLTKESTLSPSSLHYPTPLPVAHHQAVSRAPEQAVSPTLTTGKKRLRSLSLELDEINEEEEEEVNVREVRQQGKSEKRGARGGEEKEERLFVAILSYDPEAMCTTGRPEKELLFHEGAMIAVRGSVNADGFYHGSFQGKTGLVPAGFVQEMEVEDSHQRRRLLNQTLSRPHIPSSSNSSSSHTPHSSSSRPVSAPLFSPSTPLFSPSGSLLTHSHLPAAPPDPPSSVSVEKTQQKNVVIVSWTPPPQGTKVTGYDVFTNDRLRATVNGPQTRVLLPEVPEDPSVVVGVASHDQCGQQSSITSTTYSRRRPQHEQYRLCIVLYDYDPEKMSPSDSPHLELRVAEGNLLRCYNRASDREDDDVYTMAELGESNKRGLVPTEFITEVYGPSLTDPQKYEWKSPPRNALPATSKLMVAVFDYNSRQDSPNRGGMELELSFSNGDTITVYGGMDADGFYTGQVGEAFGLVPSNFLQKEKKKKEEAVSRKQTVGKTSEIEKWDIPPGMWRQLNGQEHLVSKPRSQSDTKDSSAQASDERHSGTSGSPHGSVEAPKRRWSHNLPFKNPFSRKKSEVSL